MKKLLIVLFSLVVIPTMADGSLMSWKLYLSFWPELFAIAKCESNFNPAAKHINKNGTTDGGLFQINDIHKVGNKRYDPWWSINWAIEKYFNDELDIWVCHKIIGERAI